MSGITCLLSNLKKSPSITLATLDMQLRVTDGAPLSLAHLFWQTGMIDLDPSLARPAENSTEHSPRFLKKKDSGLQDCTLGCWGTSTGRKPILLLRSSGLLLLR